MELIIPPDEDGKQISWTDHEFGPIFDTYFELATIFTV